MHEQEEAVERIMNYLNDIYVKIVGKDPDPQVLRAEAEALVAKYGPAATSEDLMF